MGNSQNWMLLLILFILSCKNGKSNNNFERKTDHLQQSPPAGILHTYPKEIDSLGIQDIYNKARWLLYCIYCDDTIRFVNENSNLRDVAFGETELRYRDLVVSGDTFQTRFEFYHLGVRCNGDAIKRELKWGIKFKRDIDKPLWYTSATGWEFRDSCLPNRECKSRYINPLQPEVINYLKKNKLKINAWFRQEAIKRGIIHM